MHTLKILACIGMLCVTAAFAQNQTLAYNWGDVALADPENIIDIFRQPGWTVTENDTTYNNIALPFVSSVPGTFTCSNSFQISDSSFARYRYVLKGYGFKGIARVFINKTAIYAQYNSSSPFSAEIAPAFLKQGSNLIEVVFENDPRRIESNFPSFAKVLQPAPYAGPARPFFIERSDTQPFLDSWEYKVSGSSGQTAQLEWRLALNSKTIRSLPGRDNLILEIALRDSAGKIWETLSVPVKPEQLNYSGNLAISTTRLWSPATPRQNSALFRLKRFGVALATQQMPLSLRDVAIKNNSFLLNGTPFRIEGIVYHEDLVASHTAAHFHRDLKQIKALGFNAIRCSDFLPDPRLLSAADELGLLVFAELPPLRYPEELFKRDDLLEISRKALQQVNTSLGHHPSLVAIGLGRQVQVSSTLAQRYFLILDETLSDMPPLLGYITPLATKQEISQAVVSDFMMLESYTRPEKRIPLKGSFLAAANAGMVQLHENPGQVSVLQKSIRIKNELEYLEKTYGIKQGFWESYRDWKSFYPWRVDSIDQQQRGWTVQTGITGPNNEPKNWLQEFPDGIWQAPTSRDSGSYTPEQATTLFSVVMFFGSLIFFIFYGQYPRFRENYSRAIKHPYGFFVDMRERRIIPVFNTLMLSLHNVLILSVFLGAFIYSWHESYVFKEIVALLFPHSGLYNTVLLISSRVYLVLPALLVILFLYPILLGFMLKIIAILKRARIRTRQAMAVGMWAAAPFIFMLPVSLTAYHVFFEGSYCSYLGWILLFFMLWTHYRLINGIRVLFMSRFRTVFTFLLLSYIFPLVIFLLFFNPQPQWFNYFLLLLQSHILY